MEALQKNGSPAEEWRFQKCPITSRICLQHICFSKMVKRVAQGYTKPSLTVAGIQTPQTHYSIIREPILAQKSHLATLAEAE